MLQDCAHGFRVAARRCCNNRERQQGMSEAELLQLYTLDEYESDYYRFEVSGYDVLVKNLHTLSVWKRLFCCAFQVAF